MLIKRASLLLLVSCAASRTGGEAAPRWLEEWRHVQAAAGTPGSAVVAAVARKNGEGPLMPPLLLPRMLFARAVEPGVQHLAFMPLEVTDLGNHSSYDSITVWAEAHVAAKLCGFCVSHRLPQEPAILAAVAKSPVQNGVQVGAAPGPRPRH